MNLKGILLRVLGACALIGASLSTASAVSVDSTAGGASCELNSNLFVDTSCTLEAITPHNLWQPNNPGGSNAVWVSYANTGIGGDTLAPTSQSDWVMKVTESFVIGAGGGTVLLQIWADDTAGVYLDGVLKAAPIFAQNVCASGPVGCEPDEFYALSEGLSAGAHSIELYVYQVGTGQTVDGNPFGLLYSGDVSGLVPGEIPAPPALALFGLAGLGLFARRRLNARR